MNKVIKNIPNKWSKKSYRELHTCKVKLQTVFNIALQIMNCSVLEGYRSHRSQLQKYADGFTTVVKGKHNVMPSEAVDVAPYPIKWNVDGKNPKDTCRFYYFAGIVKAVARDQGVELRWGGDWDNDNDFDDQTFDDLVHWELIDG